MQRIEAQPTPRHLWDVALELLLRKLPPNYRQVRKQVLWERLSGLALPPVELWHVSRRSEGLAGDDPPTILAAGLLEQQPGKVAMGTAPVLAGIRYVEAGVLLLRSWLLECQRRGLRALQILVEDSSSALRRMLKQAGFKRLTSLMYMHCPTEQDLPPTVTTRDSETKGHFFGPGVDPAWHWVAEGELRLECFSDSPAFWQRLATVVEKTYVGSLDCPEVTGLRSAYETLQGYRQNTQWRPDLWFLVCAAQEDIGCLLLGDRPQDGCPELVYMGLIPEYRGRGIGSWLVRQTQKQAILLGRTQIAVAVDVRNWPAIRTYEVAGFQSVGRADVYQHALTPQSSTPVIPPGQRPG